MLRASDVTACLVTRGDQPGMIRRIRDSLIFENVIVYDNSTAQDLKTYGRYEAASLARTPVVFFQDDDCLVPRATQEALLAHYEPGVPTAVYAHGETPAGYDDLPLVGAGALVDVRSWVTAEARYLDACEMDDGFLYYCDFALGVLYPVFKQVRLPFEIVMALAQDPSRLCNQPFAAEMKQRVTEQARAIRDRTLVAA